MAARNRKTDRSKLSPEEQRAKRSSAAKKSARTRAANEKAAERERARRSAAAKKAAATRRANAATIEAEKKRRSQAAKRAAATRRANALKRQTERAARKLGTLQRAAYENMRRTLSAAGRDPNEATLIKSVGLMSAAELRFAAKASFLEIKRKGGREPREYPELVLDLGDAYDEEDVEWNPFWYH